jgi:CheY-like chemotaxis protein
MAVMPAHARILVVEDEPRLAEILRLYLERDGHRVTVVGDGRAAIEAVDRDPGPAPGEVAIWRLRSLIWPWICSAAFSYHPSLPNGPRIRPGHRHAFSGRALGGDSRGRQSELLGPVPLRVNLVDSMMSAISPVSG